MKRYFAYGSNMDPEQMGARCPGAVLEGVGALRGYRFLITETGFGSVVPDPESTVHGVVWRLLPGDEAALDAYEGVESGLYRKITARVQLASPAESVEAMLYVATTDRPGRPKPGYLEKVLEAARHHGLPPAYLEELARWLPKSRGRKPRTAR
jgi:gamma-glutamylcyclotransferase (GGCT)/AIG2-like uncharacterized protein YtfP